VVNSEVVVAADAHAAGPPAVNARALNSTGIHRPRVARLDVVRRLSGGMGKCVIGFRAPIRAV
jgi:hypothetical protein